MIPASWAAAPNCAMGLPSDDDGELPFAALLPSDVSDLPEEAVNEESVAKGASGWNVPPTCGYNPNRMI